MSKSLAETEQIASDFLSNLDKQPARNSATVVGLSGDLGSGKTTFTQAAARTLGVRDAVQSPTFVIIKSYAIPKNWQGESLPASKDSPSVWPWRKLVHIDCYRLEKPEDLTKLGWAELAADSANLIFIEWPENVMAALLPGLITIKFETISETERKIVYD